MPGMLHIRSWLALHVGCDPDELRFAGADARRVNNVVLHFTCEGKAGYRVEITEQGAPLQRRHWQISAEWPTGAAAVTVDEKPSW